MGVREPVRDSWVFVSIRGRESETEGSMDVVNKGFWVLLGLVLTLAGVFISRTLLQRFSTVQPQPAASAAVLAAAAVTQPEPLIPAEIQMVRNTFPHNSTTTATLGQAFEDTFGDPKWSFIKTGMGGGMVQFEGTVKAGALNQGGFRWWPQTLEPDSAAGRRAIVVIRQCGGSRSDITPAVRRCLESRAADLAIPVKFQFAIAADGQSFTIADINPIPWGGHTAKEQPGRILRFIYN
jgi:hypothetical protein